MRFSFRVSVPLCFVLTIFRLINPAFAVPTTDITTPHPILSSLGKTFNVLDFGAVADARTDCTAAFQKAMDAAHRAGATVVSVPEGPYFFAGHMTIPSSVALEGTWRIPPMDHYRPNRTFTPENFVGSVLLVTEGKGRAEGTPFITLMHNATLKGLTIFYPEQTKTNPPLAYPWTIASGGADNCSIVDCLLVNPYQAVDFGSRASGRHYIRNLYGQPLYRGIYVDACFDVGRIENVHFWPFWCGDDPVHTFMETHAEAFVFGRTDWQFVTNCFTIWYHVGFRFIAGPHGPGNVLLTQSGADIGPYAVIVEGSQAHAGHSFNNCQLYGGILIGEQNAGPIRFTGCGLFGSIDGNNGVTHGVINGYGHVSFTNCHIITLDPKNTQDRNWRVDGGGVTFSACDFLDAGKEHIHLGLGTQAAVIVGNRFRGKMNVVNNAAGNVQIGLNVDTTRREEDNAIVVDSSARDGSVIVDAGWNKGFTGNDYLGDMQWTAAGKGERKVTWIPDLPAGGDYEVFVWYGPDNNNDRATNAPYSVHHKNGSETFRKNLKQGVGKWEKLGVFTFEKGKKGSVVMTNDADGFLAADAVKFLPKSE